jgi:hypothetical protein
VATNQRIAELRNELEEMERQAKSIAEAYEALKGENTDTRVSQIFAPAVVGTYLFDDGESTSECQIREQDGSYFLGTEFGQFPIKIRSGTLFEVYDIYEEKHPLKFTQRQIGTFVYNDRDRKIVLTKTEDKGERKVKMPISEPLKAGKKDAPIPNEPTPQPTKKPKKKG